MVKELMVNYDFKPGILKFKTIPLYQYEKDLNDEIRESRLDKKKALNLLEQMYMCRSLEDMLVQIKSGQYKALKDFNYIGSTHLSIGQEATSVGSISGIGQNDYITSSHRGHSDSMAKVYSIVKLMPDEDLIKLLESGNEYLKFMKESFDPHESREILEEKALKVHVYRMIAELFGKKHGYCRGVGGGMHIANFKLGHLGANAIVGGHVPIATGAAMASRYKNQDSIVLCLAGDGAFSNGVVLESLNLASMAQFKNGLMSRKFGTPIIFGIINNQYAMSGQEKGEITGVDYLSRRAAGFDLDIMHAEVVDGMDILAVRDSVIRAKEIISEGKGPVLLEFITYRYMGHSLGDPLTYRDREEVAEWTKKDPIKIFEEKLLKADFPDAQGGNITAKDLEELSKKAIKRNEDMAVFAASAEYPEDESVLSFLFNSEVEKNVPAEFSNQEILSELPKYNRDNEGRITTRLAIREALIEEMIRDKRVIIFGEDVADYGGAFGVTNDLLKVFGRDRIFNPSISEAGIVGIAVGMAMNGLKPVIEIMYDDFIMQALDQIGNQAAKWSYMSGGQISIPMVLRTTIGGGRGYAGQHSQSLEALVTHIPGLKVVAPSTPYDSKGLLKASIRDKNPVIFFEHQLIYNSLGAVPEEEYEIPIGKAKVVKEGSDITIVCWSYMVNHALDAAKMLEPDGISLEVIDVRTLIPLDIETIINSVKKTGKVIVTSQEIYQGSFMSEVITQIQEMCFDWLDAPIQRLGSLNGVAPSAQNLEKLYMPDAEKLIRIIKEKF